MEQTNYEFTPEQNVTIDLLASRMRFVGIISIILGSFYALVSPLILMTEPFTFIMHLPLMVLLVIIGLLTNNASSSFRKIVKTKDYDIPHLMDALGNLRTLYSLQFWLMIVVGGIILMIILIGVLMGWSKLGIG